MFLGLVVMKDEFRLCNSFEVQKSNMNCVRKGLISLYQSIHGPVVLKPLTFWVHIRIQRTIGGPGQQEVSSPIGQDSCHSPASHSFSCSVPNFSAFYVILPLPSAISFPLHISVLLVLSFSCSTPSFSTLHNPLSKFSVPFVNTGATVACSFPHQLLFVLVGWMKRFSGPWFGHPFF